MLIVTECRPYALTWSRRADAVNPWGKSELAFIVEELDFSSRGSTLKGMATNPYSAEQGDAATVYLVDETDRLHAIRGERTLKVVPVGAEPCGDQIEFSRSGHAIAWSYKAKVLAILSPLGEVMDRIDLVPVMARDAVEKERLQIQCARIDESSNRWYVGTSHGLAVGDLDHQSHKPSAFLPGCGAWTRRVR